MSVRDLSSTVRRAITRAGDAVQAAGRWWLNELLSCLPSPLSNWLTERPTRSLVVGADEDRVTFELITDRRRVVASAPLDRANYAPEHLDAFLTSQRQAPAEVAIGLRLPPQHVFTRDLLLPLEVKRDLDGVVERDMASKTPFQADDVFHAHVAQRMGDRLAVRQWIVRRKHVQSLADTLAIDFDRIAFIAPQIVEPSSTPPPLIRLNSASVDDRRWVARTGLALALAAVVLAGTAVGLRYAHQQEVLDRLEVDIAAARSKAQQTLAVLKGVERRRASLLFIRQKRVGEPGLLDVWAEATRLLPEHSWLTELRLTDTGEARQVAMSGFSRGAAGLVALIDRSSLFSGAALIAPIALDATEDRERFSIQTGVTTLGRNKMAAQ